MAELLMFMFFVAGLAIGGAVGMMFASMEAARAQDFEEQLEALKKDVGEASPWAPRRRAQ